MQQIFHIEIDTEKMSIEDLRIAKDNVRKLLSSIELQIRLKEMNNRKSPK